YLCTCCCFFLFFFFSGSAAEVYKGQAFVHGDLTAALGANALAVAGYVVFAVLWSFWVIRAVRGRPPRIEAGPATLWGLGVLIAVFTLVRNLPFGSWLHP
ncbi:DUF2752 domain-containing protein, partial [Streptomyces alfalfae]